MQCRSRVREHSLLSCADRQLGREWSSSLTMIRAKLQRRGTPTTYRGVEPW